jgi:ectoine hydroxylase-related dioxygenase (phytanoyl-CoA dioxygenase family)
MGNVEPYHSHSKVTNNQTTAICLLPGAALSYFFVSYSHVWQVLLKEPKTTAQSPGGGAWEWHQDFCYYYNEGLLQPDKVTNVVIAVDDNTTQNGCMRFIRCSHTLGRVRFVKRCPFHG